MTSKLNKILDTIVSGVVVVTTSVHGNPFGMTASWVTKISSNPHMIAVSISPKCFTHNKLKESKSMGINVMSWDGLKIAQHFGTKTGKHIDKFEGMQFSHSALNNPVLNKGTLAFMDCNIVEYLQAGDHTLYLAEVVEGYFGENEDPLVYYRKKYFELRENLVCMSIDEIEA